MIIEYITYGFFLDHTAEPDAVDLLLEPEDLEIINKITRLVGRKCI
jgi:RPN1 N-terminal domain